MKIGGKNLLNAINGFGDHLKADMGSLEPAKLYLTTDGKELGVYCHRNTFDGYISFEAPSEEKWCVVVAAEEFAKFIKLVGNSELDLSVLEVGENICLVVEFDGKKYKFNAIRTEYMGMDTKDAEVLANVKGKDIIAAVGAVGFAVDKNNVKPQLKSVHFVFNKDTGIMKAEALDGFRIAQKKTIAAEIIKSGEIIAKKDDIAFFSGLNAETEYTFSVKRNMFIVSAPRFQVAIAQICETFYNLETIIDHTNKNTYNLDKAELISALKRCMIFGSNAVATEWLEDGLKIIAESDKGRAEEFIPNNTKNGSNVGEVGAKICFNPALMLEAVQNADEDNIFFVLTTKNMFRLQTVEYLAFVLPVKK